ncbi:MAG: carbamate kinase [Methanobacteriota archaeon]|nr:MAG: carbamate kinase [Euryarchaeota archaeon]
MTLAVIAIGGNAISSPKDAGPGAMKSRIAKTAARLADLVETGYEIVVTHGNGPQVGNILLQNEEARAKVPAMPLDVLVAESQAQIGYLLQQALQNEFAARGTPRTVASIVTQVVVDPADPAFQEPSKPIGPTYDSEQELIVRRAKGWKMAQDPRGGWRRVVPSPRPLEIVERDLIKAILSAGDSHILIVAGGGGVPVVRRLHAFQGVEAVVDKDLASAVLGNGIGADLLVIITDVPKVALHYGKADQVDLERLTPAEARHHLLAGEFPPGSMGPKVEAALQFLEGGGRRVVITNLEHVLDAVSGRAGTAIA